MKQVMVNIWGAQKPATLTNWAEIKKLGFEVSDRSFGQLNDGTPALFFNGKYMWSKVRKPNNGKDEWFVTTEKLADLN